MILTTTSSPVFNLARWTCPTDAAAKGFFSIFSIASKKPIGARNSKFENTSSEGMLAAC